MQSSQMKTWISGYWIVVASLFLFSIRIFPLLKEPFLWAEDANIFYGPGINQSDNHFLLNFSSYAGQHWVLVHLISGFVLSIFSDNLKFLPLGSTVAALFFVILAASAWLKSNRLVSFRRNRQLIFGFVLLAPSSWESLGNIANLYVYFFIAIFAIAGWELPKTRSSWIIENVVLVLLSLTSVCSLFIVVALIMRAFLNRTRIYLFVPAVYLLFVVFQLSNWIQRGQGNDQVSLLTQIMQFFYILVKRIGVETLLGQSAGMYFPTIQGWNSWLLIGFMPIVIFLISLYTFAKYSNQNYKVRFLGIFILGGLHFMSFIYASLGVGLNQLYIFGAGGRYFLVTHIAVFVGFVIIYEGTQQLVRIKSYRFVSFAMAIILIAGVVFDFSLNSKTNPTFQTDWNNFSNCIEKSNVSCSVTVPPGYPWGIQFP